MENSDAHGIAVIDEDGVRVPTVDDRFYFVGTDFREVVEALRETHDELSPAAAKLDNRVEWLIEAFGARQQSEEDRAILAPVFAAEAPPGGWTPPAFFELIWGAVGDTEWGPEFATRIMKRTFRPQREPIFHNSMLISVVAAFEAHLAKLATEYFRAAPEALHDLPKESVREFSLKELLELNSIDDAIELAIESRVTKLMHGSLADWRKFFSDRMKLDMSEMAASWDAVREIFERRHCLVHNDALASRRYVVAIHGVDFGDSLEADSQYVRDAMDALELIGVILHAGVWRKFADDLEMATEFLERNAFEALQDERWAFSLALYERISALPLTRREKRMTEVNLWIARKGLAGLESVRPEIVAWDVSDSDELFEFAKLCLLDDMDNAFEMIPMLIERDKLDGRSLATWPLTDALRRDTRIQAFYAIMRDFVTVEAETAGLPESAPMEAGLDTAEPSDPNSPAG